MWSFYVISCDDTAPTKQVSVKQNVSYVYSLVLGQISAKINQWILTRNSIMACQPPHMIPCFVAWLVRRMVTYGRPKYRHWVHRQIQHWKSVVLLISRAFKPYLTLNLIIKYNWYHITNNWDNGVMEHLPNGSD